jgi:hypothetical protein
MNCRDTRDRLERYLDGELEMEANLEVVGHLEACSGCASVFEGERKFLDEIRRRGEGVPAPAPLRGRIERAIAGDAVPARPWPFARALVPAAAAAILVALFVSVFSVGTASASPDSMARQAAAWHAAAPGAAIPVSGTPELVSYFRDHGEDSCLHEGAVCGGMKYAYKGALVEKSGIAGSVTCWWTAGCPVSGCRMTHARFRAPPGLEKVWAPGQVKQREVGGRTVILGFQKGFV